MKKTIFLHLFLTCFTLLTTLVTQAADQDISFNEDRPTFPIILIVGAPQTINIGVVGAPANVSWGFFGVPTPIGIGGCPATDNNPYVCQGITITLPVGSVSSAATASVGWTGVAPTSGSLSFVLIVEGHAREYRIDVRRPLDLSFVLDKSGSMGIISEGTTTRWDALKTAVNNFMLKLSNPAFAQPGDRVGLTFFETGLTPSTFGNTLLPLDPGAATMVQTAMNGLSPGSSTAMGLGINDAKAKLVDATRTRDILLFTDGEQNIAPLVNTNGCDVGGVALNANCPVLPGSSGNLKIFTIGIGNPSPTYLTTLQNLATKSGGNCLLTSNGNSFTNTTSMVIGNIDAIFTQAFINLLRDNSPQLIRTKSGSIGSAAQGLVDFPLNKNVDDLLIEVSLNKNFEIPQLARLVAAIRVSRNGQDVTALATPRWVGSSPNTYMYAFSFNTDKAYANKLRSEGNWTVTAQPNGPASGLTYRIAVIADDHMLDYTCSQSIALPTVGDTQTFAVQFSDRGKPIENATITAMVYRPGDDIGDLMARNTKKVTVPARQQDKSAVGILKYQTLLREDASFVRALTPVEQVVMLTYRGNGRYEGNYSGMNVAGIYQIVFRIQGQDSIRGQYDRYEMQSMYVKAGQIDIGKSVISNVFTNGKLVMTVRPVTTYGRFLGPAASDAFDINAPSAKLNSIIDNQDGSYTLTVQSTTKSAGSISILQQKVFTGNLTEFKVSEKIPSVVREFRPDAINVLVPNKNFVRKVSTPTRVKTQLNRLPR